MEDVTGRTSAGEEATDGGATASTSFAAAQSRGAAAFNTASHRKVVAVYRSALAIVPSSRMYELHAAYLVGALKPLLQAGAGPGVAAAGTAQGGALEAVSVVGAELLAALLEAHESGMAGKELYLTWVHWAQRLGLFKVSVVLMGDDSCVFLVVL